MKNFLKRAVIFATAGALLIMAGCSNTDKTGKRAFVKINGKAYNESEMYHNIYYSMSNANIAEFQYDETADFTTVKNAVDELEKQEQYRDLIRKQKIVFVKQKVCDAGMLEEAKSKGISLTEEEKQKVEKEFTTIDEFFKSEDTLKQIKEQFYANDQDGDAKAKAYLEKYTKFFFGVYAVNSFEELKSKFYDLALVNKVLEEKKNQVADDEAYVKEFYNKKLMEQKKLFTENPSKFSEADKTGDVICFYPTGLRYVKHILTKFSEEDQKKVTEYENTIGQLETKENKTAEENNQLSQAKTAKEQLVAKMDQTAKAKADEIYGKLNNGGNFDALLKEYGQDQGMTNGEAAEKGYLINANSDMVKEFLTVAMALEKEGDISKPVRSTYGYHIIKYIAKGREGVVPYEEVKDKLFTIAMDDKALNVTTAYYDQVYDNMMNSGKVKVDYKVLGFDKETYDKLYGEMLQEVKNKGNNSTQKAE